MKKLLWAGGLILVLALVLVRFQQRAQYPALMPQRPLTAAEKMMASAQRVEIFRIEMVPVNDAPRETLDHYKILRTAVWQPGTALENAKAIVIRAAGESRRNLACAPRPGVGLRFWNGKKHQDIVLCFECMQWAWRDNGHHWESIGPSASQLLEVAIEAFPDDQALKSRRSDAKRLPTDQL